MKNTRMFKRLLMLAIPLGLSAPAWASIVPCPVFPTTAAISTLPSGAGNGCSNGNYQFTNFAVGTTTDTIGGIAIGANVTTFAVPTASTVDVGASAGEDLHFTTGAVSSCGAGLFCVSGKNQSLSSTITYEVSTADASMTIAGLDLTGTLHSHANATGAVLFLEVCPNAIVFSQGCTNYQEAQLGQINGHNITIVNGLISVAFGLVNKAAVRETVYLTTAKGEGSDAEVDAFDSVSVAPVPEPATLSLVGLTLAGFGTLRFRRRRL